MEKACELCLQLRPVVFCKADSAHLCLPCDAKVHSANPIVGCHHRTLLCDSCKYRSADIQCLDHRMFMCSVCDVSLHRKCSPHGQHRKRTLVSSFTGCPSAKDFATFWGFKLDESDGVGSHSQRFKKISHGHGHGGHYQKRSTGSSFILDQILDLKRLQLSRDQQSQDQPNDEKSSSVHEHQNPSRRLEHSLDHHHLQHSQDDLGRTGSQQRDSCLPDQGLMVKFDPLPLPFHEQLGKYFPSSSSTAGFPLHTESFWQGRSMVQNSPLWYQNMQDLGVCEEQAYDHHDPNTPDVDLTFRNFEESFGGDQQDVSYSFMEKKGNARAAKRQTYEGNPSRS